MHVVQSDVNKAIDVRDTTAWTCDACHQLIARPYYMGRYCFCSQRCRQSFRAETQAAE